MGSRQFMSLINKATEQPYAFLQFTIENPVDDFRYRICFGGDLLRGYRQHSGAPEQVDLERGGTRLESGKSSLESGEISAVDADPFQI